MTSSFDTTLVSLLDVVNKKKITVLEVTALAEVECKFFKGVGGKFRGAVRAVYKISQDPVGLEGEEALTAQPDLQQTRS